MRGGIRAERELVRLSRVSQPVEHKTRLHPRLPGGRVDLEDAVAAFRRVDHHRHVAALPRQARAGTPRQDRHVVLPADGNGLDDGVDRARDDDADGDLPVVGRIGRVERPAGGIEANFAIDPRAERGGEALCVLVQWHERNARGRCPGAR